MHANNKLVDHYSLDFRNNDRGGHGGPRALGALVPAPDLGRPAPYGCRPRAAEAAGPLQGPGSREPGRLTSVGNQGVGPVSGIRALNPVLTSARGADRAAAQSDRGGPRAACWRLDEARMRLTPRESAGRSAGAPPAGSVAPRGRVHSPPPSPPRVNGSNGSVRRRRQRLSSPACQKRGGPDLTHGAPARAVREQPHARRPPGPARRSSSEARRRAARAGALDARQRRADQAARGRAWNRASQRGSRRRVQGGRRQGCGRE